MNSEAMTAAWNIYIARVQAVVDEQSAAFKAGCPVPRLTMCPPTQKHVDAVQAAIDASVANTRLELFHVALRPFMDALDAIDNSGMKKNPLIRDCRAGIQKGYDELHAIFAKAQVKVAQ